MSPLSIIHKLRAIEWSAEIAISVAASVVAVAALGISIWQGYETSWHHRQSLRPLMRFEWDLGSESGKVTFGIKNAGTGPAEIRRFEVKLDDLLLDGNDATSLWSPVIEKLRPEYVDVWASWRIESGDIMAADESLALLKISTDTESVIAKARLRTLRDSLLVTICYCSVYSDCWLLDTANSRRDCVE